MEADTKTPEFAAGRAAGRLARMLAASQQRPAARAPSRHGGTASAEARKRAERRVALDLARRRLRHVPRRSGSSPRRSWCRTSSCRRRRRSPRRCGGIITSDQLVTNFSATLKDIAIGFAIAFVLGTVDRDRDGRSRWWEAFLGDWVMVTLTTPGLVFALVCAMIFGLGALGPIVCRGRHGVSRTSRSTSSRASRRRPRTSTTWRARSACPSTAALRHILLPFLAPFFFTAARYGFSVSLEDRHADRGHRGHRGDRLHDARASSSRSTWPASWRGCCSSSRSPCSLERGVLQRQMNRVLPLAPGGGHVSAIAVRTRRRASGARSAGRLARIVKSPRFARAPVLGRLPGGLAARDPAAADAARPDAGRGRRVHVGRDPRRHARAADRLPGVRHRASSG